MPLSPLLLSQRAVPIPLLNPVRRYLEGFFHFTITAAILFPKSVSNSHASLVFHSLLEISKIHIKSFSSSLSYFPSLLIDSTALSIFWFKIYQYFSNGFHEHSRSLIVIFTFFFNIWVEIRCVSQFQRRGHPL